MSYEEACCGFCIEPLNLSEEVKELPCGHQFCTECLVEALQKNGGLVCPYCRSRFGIVDIEALKTVLATDITTGIMFDCECDDCENKARAFCKTCGQLFCGKDLETHDKLLKHGPPLSIPIYKALQQKYSKKSCAHHGMNISLACAQCYEVFCNDCFDENTRCYQAGYQGRYQQTNKHDVRSLRKFSDSLLSELETRMSEVKVRNLRIDDFIKLAQQKSDEEEDRGRDLLQKFRRKKETYISRFKANLENMDRRMVERMEILRNERALYEKDRTREKHEATLKYEACGQVITQHITDVVSSYAQIEDGMRTIAHKQITPFTLNKSTLEDAGVDDTSFNGPVLVIIPETIAPNQLALTLTLTANLDMLFRPKKNSDIYILLT